MNPPLLPKINGVFVHKTTVYSMNLQECNGVLVVNIHVGEIRESLPHSLIVFVLFEKPHFDVALLDALDKDEHLGAAVHTRRDPADARDLEVARGRILEVVDGIGVGHGAERSIDASARVDVKGLEAEDDGVHLGADNLLGLLGGLGLEREILDIGEADVGVVVDVLLLLVELLAEPVVDGVLDVLLAGVNDAQALPHLSEAL